MQFHIQTSNGLAIYDQIVRHIKFAVANETLLPGDLIPSVRELARDLAVNPNTVARAYRELEESGVVTKRSTAGTYVSDGGSPLARRERLKILAQRADALLTEARQMGVGTEEVIELVRQRDAAMRPRSEP